MTIGKIFRKFRLSIASCLLAAAPLVSSAQIPDRAKVIAGAERAFETAAKANPMPAPGCSVGVSLKGESVFEKAFGMAEMEHGIPNTEQTVFEAASLSKQFTAAALILLQQDGKLKIDDPVRAYIPELPAYDKPITIRHILTHTAGLRDWGSVMALTGVERFGRLVTNEITLDIMTRQKHLDFAPGAEYSYTNSGYGLAAMIVERVSKQKFSNFVIERIFKPLRMTKSSWRDDHRRLIPLRALAYAREGSPAAWTHNMRFSNVVGSTGMQTTVGDLLKWNASLDARTFGESFVAALETQGVLTDGRKIAYALGVQIGKHHGFREIYHDGQQDGYKSYITRFPEKELSFAVLCNAPTPDALDIVDGMFEEILGPFPEPKEDRITLSEEKLRKNIGLWKDEKTRIATRIAFENGELKLNGEPLTPVADASFTMEDRRITFLPGSPKRAEISEFDGSVTRLTMVSEWKPKQPELAKFVGEWRSEEAQATVKFAVNSRQPVLHFNSFSKLELKPTFKDHFESGIYVVWFSRSRSGPVTNMHVGRRRLRNMIFERSKK